MIQHSVWFEKYRPKRVRDTVLPEGLRKTFQSFVDGGSIPNLLLSGPSGVGKTTVARAMLDELDLDHMVINGSLEGNIDTLRTRIRDFASSTSFYGGRKYVILDEADYLNANSTQPALRNFMEEYSANCGFILTCNYKNRIIESLHSRCSVIEFTVPKEEKQALAIEFFSRPCHILHEEGVPFDDQTVAELVMGHFPDMRRTINELQRYSLSGKIDVGILAARTDESYDVLVEALRSRKFRDVRRWVAENSDVDPTKVFRTLYDLAWTKMDESSVPSLVLILADYQHRAAFVVDQEINTVACLTQVMADCEWK